MALGKVDLLMVPIIDLLQQNSRVDISLTQKSETIFRSAYSLLCFQNNMEKKVIKTSNTLPQEKLGRTRLQAYLLHVFLIYFLY